MELQEFAVLTSGEPSLLRQVELIVLDGHRRLYGAKGKPWSKPIAYKWLRYEDPMPVARLADGVQSLLGMRIRLDRDAVDKACVEARKWGFSN